MHTATALLITGLLCQAFSASLLDESRSAHPTCQTHTGSVVAHAEATQPVELSILLDESSSMQKFRTTLTVEIIASLVKTLQPCDRFSIHTFTGSAESLFPMPAIASPGNIEIMEQWLETRHVQGGIELPGLIQHVVSQSLPAQSRRVIAIITDGNIWGISEGYASLLKAAHNPYVVSINVGPRPNTVLLEKASKISNGFAAHIADATQIPPVMRCVHMRHVPISLSSTQSPNLSL
jgi:hypothetical protein